MKRSRHQEVEKQKDDRRKAACKTSENFSKPGITLDGLRHIASDFTDGQTWQEAWCQLWGHQCLPKGWRMEMYFTDTSSNHTEKVLANGRLAPSYAWAYTTYTHDSTKRKITRTPEDREGLPGCKCILDVRPDIQPYLGTPTHYLSHPWRMKIDDVIEAAERAISNSSTEVYFWIDVFASNYNSKVPCYDFTEYLVDLKTFLTPLHVVQVGESWNERANRLWLMFETCGAVASEQQMTFAFTAVEESQLADELTKKGPNAILEVVYAMDVDPDSASHGGNDVEAAALISSIHELNEQVGGRASMVVKLGDLTRRTYAAAIERELERRWPVVESIDGDTELQLQTLDLAHQLACLWALTDAPDHAEALFQRTLARLSTRPPTPGSQNGSQNGEARHIARRDRTSAELVRLLRRQGRTEDARRVQIEAGDNGQLAVSWQGISVNFLDKFVDEHRDAVEFMSTDATVERILKPSTRSGGILFPPMASGKALIEMAHHEHKGVPKFFVSHAWRQTFSVMTSDYRGGLAQAIIHSVPECERSTTHFWCDIFCVNQHLSSPYGGLLAFAFEPLRNAMLDCDHLKIFLEHWDDVSSES